MGKSNANERGEPLPCQYSIIKAELRERETFAFVFDMIKQVLEVAFVLGYINDKRTVLKGFQERGLCQVCRDVRKERLQNQG